MKKVLSLVLVLALVLGSFSMAFAAETTTANLADIAGNANEDAIEVANDLGIIDGYPDGTFKPANAVTRAEFAKMMTKALAIPESALKGFTTSAFKDVDSTHWAVAFLGYCNSKGIMTGYEDGSARPNQTITVNEAITMICRALGYTANSKQLVGSWPANYITLAQQLNLFKDVEAVATTDRASAAQIVYNALTKDLVYVDNDGTTQFVNGGGTTMLTSLGGVPYTPAYAGAVAGDPFTLTTELANNATINVREYVGQWCTAYVDRDDPDSIIALEVLSTTLDGKYKAPDTFSTDDVDYRITCAWATANPETAVGGGNPCLVTGAGCDIAVTSAGGMVDGEDYTLAAKVSGKTITKIYSVFDIAKTNQSQFEAGDLEIDKCRIDVNGKYDFEKNKNNEIDMTKFTLLGVSSLEKIAENNVIEVYTDGTYIIKLAVGTKTVTGTITEIDTANGKYYLDGTAYKLTADDSVGEGDVPELGQSGTAYLTYGGKIAYWEGDDVTADNYGVLIKAVEDTDKFGEKSTQVKLVTKDGKTATYDWASKAKYTTTAATAAWTTVGAVPTGTIVKYAFNAKGEISTIKTVDKETLAGNINTGKTRIGTTSVANNVLVFSVNGKGEWELSNVANISTDYNFPGFTTSYAIAKSNKIVALTVNSDAGAKDETFGIITAVTEKPNADGNGQWYVKGFLDGKEFAGFVDTGVADGNILVSGEGPTLYTIEVDGDGVVTDIVNSAVSPASVAAGTADLFVKSFDKKINEVTVNTITSGGVKAIFEVAKDAVIYYYDSDKKVDDWTIADVSAISKDKKIMLWATKKANREDGIYDVVLLWDAE